MGSSMIDRETFQQRSLQCGFKYWRASDAHGITGTKAQAIDFISRLVGVEVDITDVLNDSERTELEMFRRDAMEQEMFGSINADLIQSLEIVLEREQITSATRALIEHTLRRAKGG